MVGEEEIEKEMGEEEEGEEEAGEVREKIAGEEVGEGGEVIEKEGLKDKEAVSAVVSEEEEGMAEELGEVGAELGEAAAKESIAEEEGVLEKTEAKAGLERVLDEVYSVINEKGMSLTKIKSACAKKGIKYSLVLDALNKLIDEGRVEIITHGRRTLYKKKRR
ncbi:MAG: hypothetical protein DRN20_06380 [Thermoplasmata archaeon]|nr:MAG: hypothetical protein DRN20_06380 [Thermoplasmata archaeon]